MRIAFSLALVLLVANVAISEVVAYDTFGYAPGEIAGYDSPTIGFTGPWLVPHGDPGQCTVESAGLVYPGAEAAYQDNSGMLQVRIPLWAGSRAGRFLDTDPAGPFADYINSQGRIGNAGQTLYISFLMRTNYTSPFYALELKRGDLGDDAGVLYVGNDVGGNNLQVCAFRNRDTSEANLGYQFQWLGAATTNVEHYVIRIDFQQDGDDVTVYRNPDPAAEPVKAPDLVNPGFIDFDAITVASWVDPVGRVAQFDEICFATSYADAVRFYSQAERAQNPTPADGAVEVSTAAELVLNWNTGEGVAPAGYEVYFSDVLDDVVAANSAAYQGTTAGTSMNVGQINTDSTYYWSVFEVLDPNGVPGVIWSFETRKTYPVILSQPADQHVFAGESGVFTVEVASESPESYQWFDAAGILSDGANVSGTQSATLSIADAQVVNEGEYYCEITNAAGTIACDPAILLIKRTVGHWSLDQPVGTDPNVAWPDLSGSGNNLQPDPDYTVPASVSFAAGADGTANGALVFDGSFALGTMKADGTMNDIPVGDMPFTMSVWFRTPEPGGDLGLLGWGNYGHLQQCNALTLNGNPYWLRNYWWDADLNAGGDIFLRDDNWHQVVVTYDGAVRVIYIDGLEAGSDDPVSHKVQTSENFLIGKTNTEWPEGEFFIGAIDEVKVLNYALDELEVAKGYTGIAGGDVCVYPPTYDVDDDCVVNLSDVALLATQWLECGLVPSCVN